MRGRRTERSRKQSLLKTTLKIIIFLVKYLLLGLVLGLNVSVNVPSASIKHPEWQHGDNSVKFKAFLFVELKCQLTPARVCLKRWTSSSFLKISPSIFGFLRCWRSCMKAKSFFTLAFYVGVLRWRFTLLFKMF